MWHKPCRTFHPWCLCIKTRCLLNLTVTLQIASQNEECIWCAVGSCLMQENVCCPNFQNTSLAGNFGPQIRLPDSHFGQFRAIGPMELLRPVYLVVKTLTCILSQHIPLTGCWDEVSTKRLSHWQSWRFPSQCKKSKMTMPLYNCHWWCT